ncbi:MAG: hypothetical protein H3C41_08005 [Bacteroidales bacterium]|nr:hypothetical protein [Bacteroidales bacterium]
MIRRIRHFQAKHPFLFIMAIGFILRMISVIFSKGFGMHDDHFLVIEQAQSWADGGDYLGWLPGSQGNSGPEGHSFFYVGIHYLFFKFFQLIGLHDPQIKMFFIRLIHSGISLLVISFAYRMASLITKRETAYKVALLVAVYWFMPFLSVRNMVEMVSIPFLMYGSLIILRQELIRKAGDPGYHQSSFLVAGFFLGLAFSIRFQTLIYTGGIGLALWLSKNPKGMISTALGFLLSVIPIQGFIDFLVWHQPFAEFLEYTRYNMSHANDYLTAPFYHYFIVLAGMLIPPVSLMFIFGYFRNWKKDFILFFPTLLFLLFHSLFPNKQERFILPVIPLFITLGMAGWQEFIDGSRFWQNHKKMLQAGWVFFWSVNFILLMAITPMYSKKARVESMSYLRHYPGLKSFMIEDHYSRILRYPPVYYSGQWPNYQALYDNKNYYEFAAENHWEQIESQPGFVLFIQEKNLEQRLDSLKKYLPDLVYEARFQPGLMDRLIHRINPINANETITLYRNQAVVPPKNVRP